MWQWVAATAAQCCLFCSSSPRHMESSPRSSRLSEDHKLLKGTVVCRRWPGLSRSPLCAPGETALCEEDKEKVCYELCSSMRQDRKGDLFWHQQHWVCERGRDDAHSLQHVTPQKANGNSILGQSHPSRQHLPKAGKQNKLLRTTSDFSGPS